jgi:hypothetical protein
MRIVCIIFALFLTLLPLPAHSAEIRTSEYELKAAFLFNFTQFVEWPTNAFESEMDPIVIGVLGPDPFGSTLDDLVQDESVHGRKLKVERYSGASEIKRPHILFVSKSLAAQWPEILRRTQGRPILTVSDIDRFSTRGGMIQLVTERNLVRIRINPDSARRADLNISSKLLRLADNVSREGGIAP